MSRARVNEMCRLLPGAERSEPWGDGRDAWKVGGRLFAAVGPEGGAVAVRTAGAEEAEGLVAAGLARRAPDLDAAWVALPLAAEEAELHHRIATSYELVRKGLPRRVQATLDPTSG